jgi:hypothetical protein
MILAELLSLWPYDAIAVVVVVALLIGWRVLGRKRP